MTPASLSAIIFRFIALGISLYGIFLIGTGVIAHREAKQMANMAALFDAQPPDSENSLTSPFTKIVGAFYIGGGVTVLAGSFLFLGSRRLGVLMARDL